MVLSFRGKTGRTSLPGNDGSGLAPWAKNNLVWPFREICCLPLSSPDFFSVCIILCTEISYLDPDSLSTSPFLQWWIWVCLILLLSIHNLWGMRNKALDSSVLLSLPHEDSMPSIHVGCVIKHLKKPLPLLLWATVQTIKIPGGPGPNKSSTLCSLIQPRLPSYILVKYRFHISLRVP